ncbi:hypothetical protein IMSHALPRED_009094 [Imshaugia aleurites]|uniref:RING-type domain-containing protein n=1 Tax=Imshaugia aleurites TaxID=172621 RepID=A0A8H3IMA1_9LECA|nr:hypothetical protein IMSHALPRED_009094 [Imshaugia aleurites]
MSSSQNHPTPAFTALLDAHARWQHFEQMSALGTPSPSDAPGHDEHAHLSIPTSASFILACPYIDVADLPEDERSCHICSDPYHHLSEWAGNPELKAAQRLPCGHLLCTSCLCKWLNPFDASNNNTCPFDRRVLFPQFAHYLSTEGMQERADLVDWFNAATGRRPEGVERVQTGALKAMLVERRLGDAVEELEVDRFSADGLVHLATGAREIDAVAQFACHQELQQFEHRLSTIGAIADSMAGRVQVSALQARLQQMAERLAGDRAKLQGIGTR